MKYPRNYNKCQNSTTDVRITNGVLKTLFGYRSLGVHGKALINGSSFSNKLVFASLEIFLESILINSLLIFELKMQHLILTILLRLKDASSALNGLP